jgi:hypothetical protein
MRRGSKSPTRHVRGQDGGRRETESAEVFKKAGYMKEALSPFLFFSAFRP